MRIVFACDLETSDLCVFNKYSSLFIFQRQTNLNQITTAWTYSLNIVSWDQILDLGYEWEIHGKCKHNEALLLDRKVHTFLEKVERGQN